MTKKIGGYLDPLPRSFFPKSPDRNFEIAIFFKIVENPINYVFGDDLTPPQFTWEVLQVTNFDHCLHIAMVIGKCTDVFRGGGVRVGGLGVDQGEGVMFEDLPTEEFIMREENFQEKGAGFSSINFVFNKKIIKIKLSSAGRLEQH